MTDKEAAELLKSKLDSLSSGRRSFAESILRAAYSDKGASDKQWEWIHKLATELENVAPKPADVSFPRIQALMHKAAGAVEKPTIHLSLPGEMGRVIIRTNRDGRRIFINDADRKYYNAAKGRDFPLTYGEIDSAAVYVVSPYAKADVTSAVISVLSAFEENPAKVSSIEGHATGHCCFCARRLDNPESVKVGYGPTCAARYGLPHGDTGASNAGNVWNALEEAGATLGDDPSAPIPF